MDVDVYVAPDQAQDQLVGKRLSVRRPPYANRGCPYKVIHESSNGRTAYPCCTQVEVDIGHRTRQIGKGDVIDEPRLSEGKHTGAGGLAYDALTCLFGVDFGGKAPPSCGQNLPVNFSCRVSLGVDVEVQPSGKQLDDVFFRQRLIA